MNAEDMYANKAYESFLSTLKREKKAKTPAMLDGILFESIVNQLVDGKEIEAPNEKWLNASNTLAEICKGGMKQVPVSNTVTIDGIEFIMYGICDYVKAGTIYDIKKVIRYEYGKYSNSPQHPMYFSLIPEASQFEYLIFDGSFVYKERYSRSDCEPIENIISRFLSFIKRNKLWNLYEEHWAMNERRKDMIQDV